MLRAVLRATALVGYELATRTRLDDKLHYVLHLVFVHVVEGNQKCRCQRGGAIFALEAIDFEAFTEGINRI